MGNCCSGAANEGEMNMDKGYKGSKSYGGSVLDNREVGGLRGAAKMALIVRI